MRTQPFLNVFKGPRAVRDFLNPDHNPPLPLVELPPELNAFAKDRVRIFVKLMSFLPLGNVKSLPAYNMLLERHNAGGLKDVAHLIENSSGNTVFSLAIIGRLFGVQRTKAIVSHEVSWGKLQMLRFFGAEIVVNEEPICPDPGDKNSGIHKARRVGARKGWFNPGQYDNEANPRAHEKWTGPQIWQQTDGKISLLCAGLGTTGTILGTSSYLKKKSSAVFTVGVARKPNNPVPGVRTPNLLQEIAFDWRSRVDDIQEIGTKESFRKSLELCRAGLMAGPSSGFALAGLLQFLAFHKERGTLGRFYNKDKEVVAVCICPDSPLPYMRDYFRYLDGSEFPRIEGENLLMDRSEENGFVSQRSNVASRPDLDIPPDRALKEMYCHSAEEMWDRIENGRSVPLRTHAAIWDVRRPQEFKHFHLPGSKNINFYKVDRELEMVRKRKKKRKILFVCDHGVRSRVLATLATAKKFDACSLAGGTTEWSRLNLPRIRPKVCVA